MNQDENIKTDLINSSAFLNNLFRIFSVKSDEKQKLFLNDKLRIVLEKRIIYEFEHLHIYSYYRPFRKSDDDLIIEKLDLIDKFNSEFKSEALEKLIFEKLKTILYSNKITNSLFNYMRLILKHKQESDIELVKILHHILGAISDYDELLLFNEFSVFNEESFDLFCEENSDEITDLAGSVSQNLANSYDDNYAETIEMLEEIEYRFGVDNSYEIMELKGKLDEKNAQEEAKMHSYEPRNNPPIFLSKKDSSNNENTLIIELFKSYSN